VPDTTQRRVIRTLVCVSPCTAPIEDGNLEQNMHLAEEAARQAAEQKADFLNLPEAADWVGCTNTPAGRPAIQGNTQTSLPRLPGIQNVDLRRLPGEGWGQGL